MNKCNILQNRHNLKTFP